MKNLIQDRIDTERRKDIEKRKAVNILIKKLETNPEHAINGLVEKGSQMVMDKMRGELAQLESYVMQTNIGIINRVDSIISHIIRNNDNINPTLKKDLIKQLESLK